MIKDRYIYITKWILYTQVSPVIQETSIGDGL